MAKATTVTTDRVMVTARGTTIRKRAPVITKNYPDSSFPRPMTGMFPLDSKSWMVSVSFYHFTFASLDRQGQPPNESSVFFAARIQQGNIFIGGPDLETLDVAEPDPFLLIGGSFCLLGMTCFLRKKRLHA